MNKMSSIDDNKVIIIDTAVILHGVSFSRKDVIAAVSEEVIEEVRSTVPKLRLDQFLSNDLVQIRASTADSLKKAKNAATKTGDLPNLSKADLSVIALAIEHDMLGMNTVVYTGDYAVQNVMKSLGINFKSVLNDGIKKVIKWKYKCIACGEIFNKSPIGELCPECGTESMIRKIKA